MLKLPITFLATDILYYNILFYFYFQVWEIDQPPQEEEDLVIEIQNENKSQKSWEVSTLYLTTFCCDVLLRRFVATFCSDDFCCVVW